MDILPVGRSGVGESYDRLVRESEAIQEEMGELEATSESEDGLISVKVGAGGRLISVELDPRIYRTPDSAALADSIMRTAQAAEAAVAAKEAAVQERLLEKLTGNAPEFGNESTARHLAERISKGSEHARDQL